MPDDRPPRPPPSSPGTAASRGPGGWDAGGRRIPGSLRTLPLDDTADLRERIFDSLRTQRRPVLVVLSGKEIGLRQKLEGSALIGRDPASEVTLSDAGISWHHARVEDHGDAWAIVDLGSTNGTTVNGQRCAGDEVLLAPGDRLVLGRTVLRFELQDPLDQAYDEEVQRLLDVDDLTGLYVRRRFDQELERRLERARLEGHPVALLVMDMDKLKSINDTHGHLFGAYAIAETGRLIGRVLGARGIASRFGGDEFCAMLDGMDTDQGHAAAEEIRAAMEVHVFEREGRVLRPAISIGVASFPAQADSALALFQRADEALYRAKHGGGNRVTR